MPCTKRQRGLFFYLASKPNKTKKDRATMKGLAKKCEFKHSHRGGDRIMVKRRKVCRRRRVLVGRNRCALVDCHNNIVKGRVKCRRKVAGKARRARVVTKRHRPCKHGRIKGSKKCRKTPMRRVHHRVHHRVKRRKHSSKVYRKGSHKRCRSCGGRFAN